MPLSSRRVSTAISSRVVFAALAACVVSCVVSCFAGCASTPAEPVPFKAVPAERINQQGYTDPASGKIAVDLRRARSALANPPSTGRHCRDRECELAGSTGRPSRAGSCPL